MNYDNPKKINTKPIVNIKSFYEIAKKDNTNNDFCGKPVETTDWGGITFSSLATGSTVSSSAIVYSYPVFVSTQRTNPNVEIEIQHQGDVLAEITFPKPKK